jgi:hypothetical protein
LARELSNKEIGFDSEGVRWIDDLIQQLHEQKSERGQKLVYAFAAFLGECIIRNFGGEWAIYNGHLCIRFDDGNAVFPINKVKKQLANGREGGDSVAGMYHMTEVLKPKPLTDSQQRFLSLYKARSDCRFFVLHKTDGRQEWARVKKIEGLWVAIETELASGLRVKPEVSLRVDQIGDFYLTDAKGVLADSQEGPGSSVASVHAESKRSESRLRPTDSHPSDVMMERAITRLRSSFSGSQKILNARIFESVRAPCPSWMKPGEPLYDILNQQFLLHKEGTIVWASLIQANTLLFSSGDADCPAQLVYSRDPYFDSRPQELRAIARRIFQLKNTAPAEPDEKAVADRITNEMDRSMGWKLPDALTDKETYAATFMVFRKHIPNGVLSASCFPLLVHPSTQAVMIVPFEFWPIELLVLWKERKL